MSTETVGDLEHGSQLRECPIQVNTQCMRPNMDNCVLGILGCRTEKATFVIASPGHEDGAIVSPVGLCNYGLGSWRGNQVFGERGGRGEVLENGRWILDRGCWVLDLLL